MERLRILEWCVAKEIYYLTPILTFIPPDLSLWYGNGPGNPSASAQGIGYVQELVSRLTKTRITEFKNTVNSTIVTSNVTFPLNQPIYVDATHDTVLTTSLYLLNHFNVLRN